MARLCCLLRSLPRRAPLLRLTHFWTRSSISPDLLPIPRMYSRCLPTTSRLPRGNTAHTVIPSRTRYNGAISRFPLRCSKRSQVVLDSPTRTRFPLYWILAVPSLKRSGSRITRRHDHRKAVNVPRSKSANLVRLASLLNYNPRCVTTSFCRFYPWLRVARRKL